METLPPQPSESDKPTGLAAERFLEQPVPGAHGATFSAEQSRRTIHRLVREDQICVLTFDRPGSAANIFDRVRMYEL